MSLTRLRAIILITIVLTLLLPGAVAAQEDSSRAGLIIVHGDGRTVQQCVSFSEESISGYELLQRGSLALNVEAGGFGATVCSIDGEGCSYPAESCFCRCQGSPCTYWSYWRLQPDRKWRYQPLGAGSTQVTDGAVEGWRWAEGTTRSAAEPPAVRFEDICAPTPVGALETPDATVLPQAADISATSDVDGQREAGIAVSDTLSGLWIVLAAVIIAPASLLLVWALLRRKR